MPKFSTEKLIELIDIIREQTVSGELPVDAQEKIWDALVWDKSDPENKRMIDYLFTGWWVRSHLSPPPLAGLGPGIDHSIGIARTHSSILSPSSTVNPLLDPLEQVGPGHPIFGNSNPAHGSRFDPLGPPGTGSQFPPDNDHLRPPGPPDLT